LSQEQSATPQGALDRSDIRVRHDEGVGGALRSFADRIRSGDLGMLPVAVGLVVISVVFTILNPVFLAPNNLVNLLFDCATVGIISLGIVCVLMLGEIDLSVGSMSGLASALFGSIWVTQGWPPEFAILVALIAGVLVGCLYALLYNRLGMPSFVSTLAGLLAWLGLQLYILGNAGSINLPYQSFMVRFGQILIMPGWLSYALGLLAGIVTIVLGMGAIRRRRAANLSAPAVGGVIFRAVVLTAVIEAAVYYLNLGRGVPWMFGLFVALVVVMDYAFTRTKWGRSMRAVGGNKEAARRAGINVRRI
jgi:D-xylose transport system permease protein